MRVLIRESAWLKGLDGGTLVQQAFESDTGSLRAMRKAPCTRSSESPMGPSRGPLGTLGVKVHRHLCKLP